MTIVTRPTVGPEPARRLDRAARPTPAATSRRVRRRRGSASPGRPGPSPSSAPARWACRWPPSSRATAGGHRGRRRPGGRRRDQRRAVARRRGAGPGRARRATPTPPAACGRRTDGAAAARAADVVVLIVPVMLDDEQQPDYRYMDAAVDAIAPGRPRRLAGHLRDDAAGRRHARPVRAAPRGGVGLDARGGPVRRVLAGAAVQRRRPPQPRDVPEARRRARRRPRRPGRRRSTTRSSTPRSWRCRPPRPPSSASSPTRPTATSTSPSPTSSPATPTGSGWTSTRSSRRRTASRTATSTSRASASAATASRSIPHFLLARAPELELVALSRADNDGQVGIAIRSLQQALGGLDGVDVLVLGLTYRARRQGAGLLAGAAADRAPALQRRDRARLRPAAHRRRDRPLRRDAVATGATTAPSGPSSPRPPTRCSRRSTSAWFPALELVFDGRNSPPRPRAAGRRRLPRHRHRRAGASSA